MSNSKYQDVPRNVPPTYPSGIRTGFNKEIMFIDFFDISGNDLNCYSSVAITKSRAVNLVKKLNSFIDQES